METFIWLVGIGLPVAALLYLFGWLVGFNAGSDMCNWGAGYEDGWKAHENGWEAYNELVRDTRRTE